MIYCHLMILTHPMILTRQMIAWYLTTFPMTL
jgi:hypothetical protein